MKNRIQSCGVFLLGIMVVILFRYGHTHHWYKKALNAYHTTYLSAAQQKAFYARYQPGPYLKTTRHSKDIPHLIHFIWVSKQLSAPEHLPMRMKRNIEGWAELNPNMRVVLWTNQSVQKYFPELVAKFHQIEPPALIADILRYKILDQYGGLYLDTDIVALKSIAPLLKRTHGFAVCSKTGKPQTIISNPNDLLEKNCVATFNAVIASYPGDDAVHHAFKHAWTNVKSYDHIKKLTLEMAGPRLFDRYIFATKKPILRLQSFFPCKIDDHKACYQKDYSNNAIIYGMHTWEGSWI